MKILAVPTVLACCVPLLSCSAPVGPEQKPRSMETEVAQLEEQSLRAFGISMESLALLIHEERTLDAPESILKTGSRGQRYSELQKAGYVRITPRGSNSPGLGGGKRIIIEITPKGEKVWAAFRHELPQDRPVHN